MAKYAKQTEADGWQLPVSAGSPSERCMWRGSHLTEGSSSLSSQACVCLQADCPWLAAPPPANNKSTLVLVVPQPLARSRSRVSAVDSTLSLGLLEQNGWRRKPAAECRLPD